MKIYKPGDVKHGCEVHYCVDLDGTLARHEHGSPLGIPGPPIMTMVNRVKRWLEQGWKVKIFTARAYRDPCESLYNWSMRIRVVEQWCREYIGQVLEVTNQKDPGTLELWDDRAVSVHFNAGTFTAAGDVADVSETEDIIGHTCNVCNELHVTG